ncbi:MAG: tetratricopeptide repeat protein, partial [Candidatus Eisenbacteria bacterium]|nr:tetratricopeptide repeat protein [Candidatus Eisenbacteria bacterium]
METSDSVGESQGTLLLIDVRQEARRALEQEVCDHADFPDCHNRLGLLNLVENQLDKAIQSFQQAVQLNPLYMGAQTNLRLAQQLAGKIDEIQIPISAPEGSESWVYNQMEEVWSCLKSKETDRALSLLDPLLSMDRYRLMGWIYGAFVLISAGRAKEASEKFEKARRASVATQEVLSYWGFQGSGQENEGEVLRNLVDQVSWFPTLSDLYDELGLICARNGLVEEAKAEFYRSFLVWPLESHFHLRLADLAQAANREDETLSHLSKAIESEPTNVKGRIALGFEYASQGFVDEAIVQFEVAAKLRPDFPDVRYNLGLLYLHQDRSEEAIRHLEKALEIHSDYVPARATLAMALMKLNRHDEALRHYEALMSRGVDSPDILAYAAQA